MRALPRKFTPDEDKLVLEWAEKGYRTELLAQRLGRNSATIVARQKYLNVASVDKRRRK